MAAKKKPNSLDFARAYLRKKPSAPYAEIRDAAKKKKLMLYPISFGRALALEGIIKVAKYGSKKKKKAKASSGRGPGRPKGSKNKSSKTAVTGVDSIDGLVSTIKNLQSERDRALRAIGKIRTLLDEL